ncbi:MAG: 30S ribosomal protein S1 [Chitinophagales bacterium]
MTEKDLSNQEVGQEENEASNASAKQSETQDKKAVESTVEVKEEAHDDFDWDAANEHVSPYTEAERERIEKEFDETLKDIEENEIVSGKVVGITSSDVVLNIGFKSDGLVSTSEFRDVEELKIGDEFDVYVESKEDLKGQLILSRKKAKLTKAWDNIVEAHNEDRVIKGRIVSKTKGGLIANVFGLETFLPGSQIDVKPIVDYDAYVGKTMEFKVVKINEAIKNAVVSHKALIESDLEEQRVEIMSKLEKGQVLEGTIKNITDFGAFIDLGGVDGLLYITDISWGRINHPSEVLELNQNLNVVVLEFDDNKKRISLGLKQLEPHPWDVLDEKLEVGSKVDGKVVNIEDYGAFLEITPGVEGLVHVSEVSWSTQPVNSKEFFKLGDVHEAVIMTLDRESRKMSLSIKRLQEDPWEKIKKKYPEGTKTKGLVQNITPYGVFVELEEGIGGMVHISDLSWTKRYSHPTEFVKTGEELEVVVLEIDMEERKLTLGHKQIEEDPWDTFENVFPEGSVHEGIIIRKEDNGGIVQLPYGLEAFAPMKHLKKEDGSMAEADEQLDFKVIEFDRTDKKIIISHSRIFEEERKGDKTSDKKSGSSKSASKQTAKTKRNVEKTTLGDLDVLSELQAQMKESESGTAKKATKKKADSDSKSKTADKKADASKTEKAEDKKAKASTSEKTEEDEKANPKAKDKSAEESEAEKPASKSKTAKKKGKSDEESDDKDKEEKDA